MEGGEGKNSLSGQDRMKRTQKNERDNPSCGKRGRRATILVGVFFWTI